MRHAARTHDVRPRSFVLAVIAAAALAACGGGGGDSSTTPGGGTGGGGGGGGGTSTTLSVHGVAATGAALTGANVTAKCATGTQTGTTGTDGSYTLSITDGVLPCVLEASSGSTTLHSLASGSGTTATANITPVTELVVAQLSGQDPATFFAGTTAGSASIASTVTTDAVAAASQSVVQTLAAAGLDTTAVGDPLTGTLAAGSGSGYDGVLDTLGSTLASSGATLATLTATVAANSPASTSATSTTASSSEAATTSLLPAALLLKPKAASCDALRNGSYRFLIAKPSASTNPGDPVTTTGNATMDVAAAAGPTWDFGDGTVTLTSVAGENCHYTVAGTDGLTGEFVISPSGYAVGRLSNTWTDGESAPDAAWRMAIAIPTQAMTLADLAGKWNGFGWEAATGGNIIDPGLVTIDAAGAATISCSTNDPATPEASCSDVAQSSFVANADGGFDLSFTAGGTDVHRLRAWGFRAGNGTTVVTILRADGGVHILTPYRTLSNASVGDTHKAWNVALNNAFVASDALAYNRFEITGIDTSTGSLTRTVTALATNVSHSQTLQVNKARNGWVYRAAGTAAGSDGSSVTVRAMYSLKLGIGVSAYWLPANNQAGTNSRFAFSVTQP